MHLSRRVIKMEGGYAFRFRKAYMKQMKVKQWILCLCIVIMTVVATGVTAAGAQELSTPENFKIEPCTPEDWQEFLNKYHPGLLTEDDYDVGFMKLSWDPVPGAAQYYIFFTRQSEEGGYYYGYTYSPWNEYCCALFPYEGVLVSVEVSPMDQDGNISGNTAAASCVLVWPCTQLKCTEKGNQVHLTWESGTSLPQESVSYTIYRNTENSGSFSRIGKTKSCAYDDPYVTAGTTYVYSVVTEAVIDGLQGTWCSAPCDPGSITVTAGAGSSYFMLPDNLTIISEESFAGTNAAIIVMPASVQEIKSYAFANCPNLSRLVLLGENTEIAKNAFEGCKQQVIIDQR